MESLIKRLQELEDLVKKMSFMPSTKPTQLPTLPAIKQPKLASPAVPKAPKMPGINPASKKNPTNVAQQLKDPTERKTKLELLKVEANGQWSLK